MKARQMLEIDTLIVVQSPFLVVRIRFLTSDMALDSIVVDLVHQIVRGFILRARLVADDDKLNFAAEEDWR